MMARGLIDVIREGTSVLRKTMRPSTPMLTIVAQKHHAVASTEAKPDLISTNLSFRPAYDSPINQDERPLVLLYSWLVAKSKHIHKYGDFYLQKGYDVLHIKINPTQALMPTRAQKVVGQVVDFMQEPPRLAQPVLIHAFSVGGYLYGETLVKIMSDESVCENMRKRFRGQIFDSMVTSDGIPYGFSRAVTDNKFLQGILKGTLSGYLRLMKNRSVVHYERSQRAFIANDFRTPTLFLYSPADKIGRPQPMEEVTELMREKGIEVFSKKWPDSKHVSHFHTHPVEYVEQMTRFLQNIHLLPDESQDTNKKIELANLSGS